MTAGLSDLQDFELASKLESKIHDLQKKIATYEAQKNHSQHDESLAESLQRQIVQEEAKLEVFLESSKFHYHASLAARTLTVMASAYWLPQ